MLAENKMIKNQIQCTNIFPTGDIGEQNSIRCQSGSQTETQQENGLVLENQKLRNQVLDLQLKQRTYITKIINLQTVIAKLNLQMNQKQNMKRSSIDGRIKTNLQNLTNFQNIPKKQTKQNEKQLMATSDEKKFCNIMIKTYNDLFQITGLKQIWKKHKQILGQWMFTENPQS